MSKNNEKENALDKLYFKLIGEFKQGDHITFLDPRDGKRRLAQIIAFGEDVEYTDKRRPFVMFTIKFPEHQWTIHSYQTGKDGYDFEFVRAKSPSPVKSRRRRHSIGGRRRRTLRRK